MSARRNGPGTPGIYERFVRAPDGSRAGRTEGIPPDVAGNGLRQITAHALQSTGDQVVNAKTVLPWLLSALGVPAALVGLLVPIRESGSMLPQAAMLPWVRRQPVRKWVCVAGSAGQALATAAMAVIAATATGLAAGVGILLALDVAFVEHAHGSHAFVDHDEVPMVLAAQSPPGVEQRRVGIDDRVTSGWVGVLQRGVLRRWRPVGRRSACWAAS